MALTSGTKLGPYEIQSPLGAGGMGEVYRAIDTRLERTVAIKILPEHLSDSAEARQRFDREARSISSLSHPNICHLYDVGQQDGTSYLVMEYIEGETLGQRLRKGRVPLEQVFRIGAEICEGLEKAHRSGVVHRDLKPGNIMLAKGGAKLMDRAGEGTCGSAWGRLLFELDGDNVAAADYGRYDCRHDSVHVAGTVGGKRSGHTQRHLFPGCGSVRDGNRHEGV